MRFGEISVSDAVGAILAHSVKHADGVFKKGRVLSASDIAALEQSGVETIFAARLDDDDIAEDEAAAAVARVIGGDGTIEQQPFTGRANLHSSVHGVAVVDLERVQKLNRLHESLTLATVAAFDVIEPRQLVATVKVIPFSVPREVLEDALTIAGNEPLIRIESFRPKRAGLVLTRLAQTKPSLLEKSETAIRDRLAAMGGSLGEVLTVPHATGAVTAAINELHGRQHNPILVFGASAIVDRGDVVPAGLTGAGGEVVHLGMPVDPGNLLMFGRLEGVPVIGVPTCARSPKLNGFDWILARVMAGLHISAQDIMDLGAGGLLKEISTRPLPRESKPQTQKAPQIAAVILAAGRSTRMGANKLAIPIKGMPMVRHTVKSALDTGLRPVIVVTGHESERMQEALAGLDVVLEHNHDFAQGLSTSLRAGLKVIPESADGALVFLGDMPLVAPKHIGKLIAAFSPQDHRTICVPVHEGERGNPVLWGREHFAKLLNLEGDRGARSLMDTLAEELVEVAMPDDAVLRDFDTPESLAEQPPA